MLHFSDGYEIKRHERLLLRPWLENLIDSGKIPGLQWFDSSRVLFRVPWKHQSRKTWSLGHSSVFLEWAKNTGRWKEGDPEPHYAQLKTRLRCAFSKAPDIEEMKELHCSKADEPYKVYRFIPKKESKLYPFGRKAVARKSIPCSLKRSIALSSYLPPDSCVGSYEGEPASCGKKMRALDELPVVKSKELATDHVRFDRREGGGGDGGEEQDHKAEPVTENEVLPVQLEKSAAFHGHVAGSGVIGPSVTHPVCHAILESQKTDVPGLDLIVAEPLEVNDYCSGNPLSVLPPVEGRISQPESKDSAAEGEVKSMSVNWSQNVPWGELSAVNNSSRSDFNSLDLPNMSVLEKVTSWKVTSFTPVTAATAVTVPQRTSPFGSDQHVKRTEQLAEDAMSRSLLRNSVNTVGNEQQQRVLPFVGNGVVSDVVTQKEKNFSFARSTDRSAGTNVAIATPIFPLKNRYNVSRNSTDRDKPRYLNDCQYASQTFSENQPTAAMTYVVQQSTADRSDVVTRGASGGLHEQSGRTVCQEMSGQTEWSKVLCSESFPEASNNCDGNWKMSHQGVSEQQQQRFVRKSDDNLEKHGQKQTDGWRLEAGEGKVWPKACLDQREYMTIHEELHEQNWQVPDERCGPDFVNSGERYYQNVQNLDGFCDRRNYGHQDHDGNAYNDGVVTNGKLTSKDCDYLWQSKDSYEKDAQHIFSCDTFTKDGPLDLSNKADLVVQYAMDSFTDSSLSLNPSYSKILNVTQNYGKMSEEVGDISRKTDCVKALRVVEGDQECHLRKLGNRGHPIAASLSHLKAAYKKLVIRTMFVAEKERELDSLEKKLLAREEAVRQKEQRIQAALNSFVDRRHSSDRVEIQQCDDSIRLLPLINSAAMTKDDVGRKWPTLAPDRGLAAENFRTERNVEARRSPNWGEVPLRSFDQTKESHLYHALPKKIDLSKEDYQTMRFTRDPADFDTGKLSYLEPEQATRNYQNEAYVSHRYAAEEVECSDIRRPALTLSYGSCSSFSLQNSTRNQRRPTENKEDVIGVRVGSERPLFEETDRRNISLNSYPVQCIQESCAEPVGNYHLGHRSFQMSVHEKNSLLRNSFDETVGGENDMRILPPVSPEFVGDKKW